MSAELHRLRHRIRERKAVLRREIKAGKDFVRRKMKDLVRHEARRIVMSELDIQILRDAKARLERRKAALWELVELTRR